MKRHRIASEERMATILDTMEDIARDAGRHLEQITEDSYVGCIDASTAISFVILVDTKTATSSSLSGQHGLPGLPAPNNNLLPGFGTFHEFFLDLEDRLLDECDEYWDRNDDDDDDEEGDDSPLGCEITIAAFHPQWQFGSNDNNINNNDNNAEGRGTEQSIDFEKRTPYPTLSIVMSTAIDALMKERSTTNTKNNNSNDEDDGDVDNVGDDNDGSDQSAPATQRIAALNEKTLKEIGVEVLRHLFDSEVIGCPVKHG
mmetsp:Transcript_11942/g.21543  ORF Transcript_11942/g.21543 Transcript_11942/m.21543 type:complete len:258 (-) Transcript_11942:38-811(-)